jgi:hypothetical protein
MKLLIWLKKFKTDDRKVPGEYSHKLPSKQGTQTYEKVTGDCVGQILKHACA